jgi:hypothetical protein
MPEITIKEDQQTTRANNDVRVSINVIRMSGEPDASLLKLCEHQPLDPGVLSPNAGH